MKVSPTSLCADDWQVLKYPRTTDWHEKGWRGLEPCSLPCYGSQPERFGAEGRRSGLKIDRNCLPGSLLHWTTFEVNIKATFPAQAGFSSRLITVEQSLTCGRPEAHFAPEETRPKASKDEEICQGPLWALQLSFFRVAIKQNITVQPH